MSNETSGTGAADPLYPQAVALVREHGRGSISLVQWRLRIGYVRAAHMLEAMVGTVIAEPAPTARIITAKDAEAQ